MRLWGYYAWHSLVNSIKKIFRSQVAAAILGILLIGGLLGGAAGILSSVMFSDRGTEIGEEEYDSAEEAGDEEEYDSAEDEELTEEDIRYIKMTVETGIMLLLIVFLLSGMYQGSRNGSDIFLMADVNFLFTAPYKPQSVLIFRLSFQIAGILLASLYMLFQIPNLLWNLHLSPLAIFVLLLAWVFLLAFQKLTSVFVYTLTATYTRLRQFILPAIAGIVLLIAGVTAAVWLLEGKNTDATVSILYTSHWSRMIPVIGWMKAMVMAGIEGKAGLSAVYIVLLLAGMALICWGIWKLKADFYEDALSGAETRDELIHAAEESAPAAKKERSERIKRNLGMKGWGAGVFFAKAVYNRRRFSWFGVITKTMLIYFLVSVLVTVSLTRGAGFFHFSIIGILLGAVLFFRSYGNPIAEDSSRNWLFLVPDNPYKKVFCAMMAGTYACALDIFPAVLAAAVIGKAAPFEVILWFVVLVTLDFMLSAVGLMLEALFPADGLNMFKSLLQIILRFVVLFLVVLALAAGWILGGIVLGLVFVLVLNAALGALGFFLYPTLLHDGIS